MLKFLYDLNKACEIDERAKKRNIKAFQKSGEASRKLSEYEQKTKMTLEKLSNRKKGILETSLMEFVGLFERIMQIEFTESDGIKEILNNLPAIIDNDHQFSSVNMPKLVLNKSETAAVMLKGFLYGGPSGALGALVIKDSEINSRMASMRLRESEVYESHTETICTALDAIMIRADKISGILTKINILFRKSSQIANDIIDKNGTNRHNYNDYEKKRLMSCINLASALKSIIDTKLLDENGVITQQSFDAIETGNEYLQKIQNLMTNE